MKQLQNSGIRHELLGNTTVWTSQCGDTGSYEGPSVLSMMRLNSPVPLLRSILFSILGSMQCISEYFVFTMAKIFCSYSGFKGLDFIYLKNMSACKKNKTFTNNPGECGWCYTTLVLPPSGYIPDLFSFFSLFLAS